MKYLKCLLFGLGLFFIFNLIVTLFSYFDIFSNSTILILKIITFILSFLISSLYLGLKSKKKGYLEWIKMSLLFIVISIILTLLIPGLDFSFKTIIYYLLIILISSIGSTLGINLKKAK